MHSTSLRNTAKERRQKKHPIQTILLTVLEKKKKRERKRERAKEKIRTFSITYDSMIIIRNRKNHKFQNKKPPQAPDIR